MLFRLLKRTGLYKRFARVRDQIFDVLARLDSRQDALMQLVQRAPSDNAVAEARQAALLREIRELSDSTTEMLVAFGRRIDLPTDRGDLAALQSKIEELEQKVAAQNQALERAVTTERELRERLDAIERKFEAKQEGLEIAVAAGRERIASPR
jgi:chromosome segregation ATPase